MSNAKAAIHGVSIFHLNIIFIVIWKVIVHVTETLRCPSGSSWSRYCPVIKHVFEIIWDFSVFIFV